MIAKWGTMLGAFDIKYIPWTTVKGQVLAYIVAEFTEDSMEGEVSSSEILMVSTPYLPAWAVYIDGAANQKRSGVGTVLISPKKIIVEKSSRLGFLTTNNEAKYEALLAGMAMVN